MVSRLLAFALVAGLGSAFAQTQNASSTDSAKAPTQESSVTPSRVLTHEERGDIFMARKMYREAIEEYSIDSKSNAVLCNKIGIAYYQLGQLDKAKKQYQTALKLRPRYAEAQNNLGTIYHATKSYRRAISAYRRALQIAPNSASFHKNLGTAYFARKMDKEAIQEYQAAMTIDPNIFEDRSSGGTVLELLDASQKARYHYAIAKLYAKDGRTELAIQYLRKALEEGFKDKKKLQEDPEFQAMRELPEFKELLASEPRVL